MVQPAGPRALRAGCVLVGRAVNARASLARSLRHVARGARRHVAVPWRRVARVSLSRAVRVAEGEGGAYGVNFAFEAHPLLDPRLVTPPATPLAPTSKHPAHPCSTRAKMPLMYPASFADFEIDSKEAKCLLQGAKTGVDADGNVVGPPTSWADEVRVHAPFAIEDSTRPASGNPVAYGASGVQFKLPRQTDGCYKSAIALERVGICAVRTNADGTDELLTGAAAPYYINGYGCASTPQIRLTTTELQDICNPRSAKADWIKYCVQTESDKQMHEAVHVFELPNGDDDVAALQAFSRNTSTVYHPMGFSKDDLTSKALLCCVNFLAGGMFVVNFERKEALIALPGGAKPNVRICVRPNGASDAELAVKLASGAWKPATLQDTDLKATVEVALVGIDDDERADLMARNVDQLWAEVEEIKKVVPAPPLGTAGASLEYDLSFTKMHVYGRFALVAQRAEASKGNTPFDFGGVRDPDTGVQRDIIQAAGVNFGQSTRIPMRPSIWLREYKPTSSGAARVARGKFIYHLPFCLDMADIDHTGGPDLAVVDVTTIPMLIDASTFTPESPTITLHVFLHGWRWLRYREGGVISRFQRL